MRSSKICFTFFFLTLLGVNVAQGQPGASKDSSFSTIKANALKFAPMELMNGDFPIYYEHRFSNHFAAQVGVGLTFKDLFWELSRTFNDLDQGHETEANAGFSVKGELRYYISDQRIALNGTYFAARGSYRYYNALCAVCLDRLTLDTGPFLNETRNTTDGLVILGYQYYTKSNFIIDGYIGGGVRLMSGHIARCVQVSGSEPMPVLRVEQDFEPRFAIGLRFGFGL